MEVEKQRRKKIRICTVYSAQDKNEREKRFCQSENSAGVGEGESESKGESKGESEGEGKDSMRHVSY